MKIPSEKQKLARERNWNKAQVKNIRGTATRMQRDKALTDWERHLLNKIADLADTLMDAWDGESEELGFHVKPKESGDEQ